MKRMAFEIIVVTSILAGMLFAEAVFADDLDSIVESCGDCHGDNGVSQWDNVPTIAGIDSFVGSEALFIYRDEARPCATSEYRQGDTSRSATNMCDIAAELSDETIEAIAEHFTGLPFVAASQAFDSDLAAAGKLIHDRACERCHSDGGTNPDDEAGILAGQWTAYLKSAFDEYAAGEREQLEKMKTAMDALSADDVQALLHFYASQQ
jgi:sulfide dehydrogenase cytochrome subunit